MTPIPPMPPMPNMDMDIPNVTVTMQNTSRTGLLIENLTPQLAEFFGAKNGRGGVLVKSVDKGSISDAGGVKAGDVIVAVNKEPVADLSDFRRAVRNNSGPTPFTILRDKKEQTLTLKLPERKRGELRKDGLQNFDIDVDLDGFDSAAFQKEFAAKFDQKKMKEFQKQMEKFSKDLEKQKLSGFDFQFEVE
jgi:C-terminal processing protease CtpA/Prc